MGESKNASYSFYIHHTAYLASQRARHARARVARTRGGRCANRRGCHGAHLLDLDLSTIVCPVLLPLPLVCPVPLLIVCPDSLPVTPGRRPSARCHALGVHGAQLGAGRPGELRKSPPCDGEKCPRAFSHGSRAFSRGRIMQPTCIDV